MFLEKSEVVNMCRFGVLCRVLEKPGSLAADADNPVTLLYTHQSFQEYLAACYLSKAKGAEGEQWRGMAGPQSDESWLDTLSFLAELEDTPNAVRAGIAESLLDSFSSTDNKSYLYRAAHVLGQERPEKEPTHTMPQSKRRACEELIQIVTIPGLDAVLEDDQPFRAISELREIEFLCKYSAAIHLYNSVNRFYAFKYAFISNRDQISEAVLKELTDRDANDTRGIKIDHVFGLTHMRASVAHEILVDITLRPFLNGHGFASSLPRRLSGRRYIRDLVLRYCIKPVCSRISKVPFFICCQEDKLWSAAGSRSWRLLHGLICKYAARCVREMETHNSSWEGDADLLVFIAGHLGCRDALEPLISRYLTGIPEPGTEGLYRQSAVACAFCGSVAGTEDVEVEKVTSNIIELFRRGQQNPFRHQLAGSLAGLGSNQVADYFLDVIADREEPQRWLATMVLGCIPQEYVLRKLEQLAETGEEKTQHFAKQAILIHYQTFVGTSSAGSELPQTTP